MRLVVSVDRRRNCTSEVPDPQQPSRRGRQRLGARWSVGPVQIPGPSTYSCVQPSPCPSAPPATAGGWRRERRELYHGIPVVLAARDCPEAVWNDAWRLLVDADAVFNRFAPTSE